MLENNNPKKAKKISDVEANVQEVNPTPPTWKSRMAERFLTGVEAAKTRRIGQQNPSRSQITRDRSKTFLLLALALLATTILFLRIFSRPAGKRRAGQSTTGKPNLGRRETPGQSGTGDPGSVTPLLSADLRAQPDSDPGMVTEKDIQGTSSRSLVSTPPQIKQSEVSPKNASPYALGRIEFSDVPSRSRESLEEVEARIALLERQARQGISPQTGQAARPSTGAAQAEPSLVYIRNSPGNTNAAVSFNPSAMREESPMRARALDFHPGRG